MALSEFLKEETSRALEASREKQAQKREIEAQHREAFLERYTERAAEVVQILEEEVQEAYQKADEIANLPFPKDATELIRMLRECEKYLSRKITKSAVATKLEGLGDDGQELPNDIDFEQPSKIIHKAWEERFNMLARIAKEDYQDDEKIKKSIQRMQLNLLWNKIKLYVLYVGVFIGAILLLAILGTIADNDTKKLKQELNVLIEEKSYSQAESFIDENDMSDDYYEMLVDKMINDEQYQEGLRIASEQDLGWSFIQPRMENIAREYLKTHTKKQTIQFIEDLLPLSADNYKGLTDATKEHLKLK